MKFEDLQSQVFQYEAAMRRLTELKKASSWGAMRYTMYPKNISHLGIDVPEEIGQKIWADHIVEVRAIAQELAAQIGVEYEEPENG